jgi:hypothetical protein
VRAAAAAAGAAGLIHLPTRVDALKREWSGASDAQHKEFLKWLNAKYPKPPPKAIADAAGRLLPEAKAFLAGWIASYGSKPGRIMKIMGFKGFDPTLSTAIYSGHELRAEVLPKLRIWLSKQGFR